MRCWNCQGEVGRAQIICDTCGIVLISRPVGVGAVPRPQGLIQIDAPLDTTSDKPLDKTSKVYDGDASEVQPDALNPFQEVSGWEQKPHGISPLANDPSDLSERVKTPTSEVALAKLKASALPSFRQPKRSSMIWLSLLALSGIGLPVSLLLMWRLPWPQQKKLLFTVAMVSYGLMVLIGAVLLLSGNVQVASP